MPSAIEPSASSSPARPIGRRAAVVGGAALGLGLGLTGLRTARAEPVRRDPFLLGVASGDPLPDAVVLWTRLVADPFDASAMGRGAVPVTWEIAADEHFTRVVRRGTATARPELAHSVHVDARGLRPDHVYWYRFRAGRHVSPTGRTRTAPETRSRPNRLRVGVVNCQDWQNGYWPAYLGLAAEDLDVVVHLGDYIYEYDPSSAYPDRLHTAPETAGLDQLVTLADYRARHAQYKTDPALQGAHAAFPWIVTWDDHETENNYAGLVDEIDDTGDRFQDPARFARQRAAAYQAYWEHMPLRRAIVPGSADYRIHRRFEFGDLVRLNVLDTRQYRTDQPGGRPGDFGPVEDGLGNTSGTLLGTAQERWLADGLRSSRARWNVLAQQVMVSQIRFPNFLDPAHPFPPIANLDQWDGYDPARTRLLRLLRDTRAANPVVLAGDIHSTWCSDLRVDRDDLASAPVAVEFTATSVSSDFPAAFDGPLKAANPTLNPHVRYFDGARRGYLRVTVDRERWLTDVRTVDTIATRESPVRTSASWAARAGVPGLTPG
ncbi:alkaline phosphatase D family protein [Yinghuangia sp. ASG 101]|uniref:alkaline phosphatase D family protein n=1 Tax=Yinghuangia sp. ASG 101 TaxID=2896848 RepID=UPI001E2EFB6C|nr:alkaline phosphatase D family protein [Yinghuangia sp. ASG 101]UGQ12557.1 alkaline phosphatase D family protein [Yinghuangia sp. ASG 101]